MTPPTAALVREIAVRSLIRDQWPIALGATWSPGRGGYDCGRATCGLKVPHLVDLDAGAATGDCRQQASPHILTTPEEVFVPLRRFPYSPLLVTGRSFDAIEGPYAFINEFVRQLESAGERPPSLRLNERSAITIVQRLDLPEDAQIALGARGVRHHGTGSWVPLPPAEVAGGHLVWDRDPGTDDVYPAFSAITLSLVGAF